MAKWIEFVPVAATPSHKTKRWVVRPKDGSNPVGGISWYGPWRRYVFSPAAATVFEEQCLRDIAEFVADQTREHRAQRKLASHG